jgi:hypothetical protein
MIRSFDELLETIMKDAKSIKPIEKMKNQLTDLHKSLSGLC